jgi:hypothetical protein
MFRMVGGSLGVAVTGAIFQGLVSSHLTSLLSGSGISAADRAEISEQLGSGSVSGALRGLDPAQAKEAAAAGADSFVYALGHAMTVSAVVALVGAVIGIVAIRSKSRKAGTTLEETEAAVNPGGSAVTAIEESPAREPVAAGEPVA